MSENRDRKDQSLAEPVPQLLGTRCPLTEGDGWKVELLRNKISSSTVQMYSSKTSWCRFSCQPPTGRCAPRLGNTKKP